MTGTQEAQPDGGKPEKVTPEELAVFCGEFPYRRQSGRWRVLLDKWWSRRVFPTL